MGRALYHGLLGAALTVLAIAAAFGPILVVPAVVPNADVGAGGLALPLTVVGTLALLVSIGASVWVGYREQRRHGVRDEYRRFAVALGGGGAAVVLVAVLALAAAGTLRPVSPALVATTVLSGLVAMPVVALVAALAGVTLASLSTAWRRSEVRFGRPLVVPVGAALVAGGSVAVDSVTRLATSLTPAVGLPEWVPGFGTVGETVTVYSSLDSALSGVVLVVGAGALGAYAARHHGFGGSVRRFVVLVSVGSVVGVVLVPLVVLVAVTEASLASFFGSNGPVALGLASLANTLVETGLVATLAALAGLGVATFEAGDEDGSAGASAGVGETPADGSTTADRGDRSRLSPADEAPR